MAALTDFSGLSRRDLFLNGNGLVSTQPVARDTHTPCHIIHGLPISPIPIAFYRYLYESRNIIRDQPYHRHVACDLMKIILQVADGMVSERERYEEERC